MGEKSLSAIQLTVDSYPEYIKNSKKKNIKRANNLISIWANELNRHSSNEEV
jgi:hypothetical protein